MFKLEVENNIYRYIDTDTNNEFEITLNLDPILDCNFKYTNEYLLNNINLLEYAINDIKKKYNNLTYISKYDNEIIYNKLKSLNFKIQAYDYIIPFKKIEENNHLQETKQINEAKKYIIRKLNEKAKINSKYLQNPFKEYTEKIFNTESDKYTIKTIEEKGIIKGAVEYFVADKIYIRNIFANNKKYLEDIIYSLLNYHLDISLGCMPTDKELLTTISHFKGVINYIYFIWKEEQ